ncbi:fibronectin type III domain-containing protein [Marinobacter salinexigens]|uniref:Fibronectin type III domain-containing protein n=1 Tax=Marinobacter salinexigens TaxID=2919747 RepID=A0A5B0V7T3_9GAMM|nr:fibronectin type III domain-containing protein [Marinobacter salinexigens]KAA1170560.1 fibronectin type III domain-containing protein [Marinobacter salinexigens]
MTYCGKKLTKQGLLIGFTAALLSGCGGGQSGGDATSSVSSQAPGTNDSTADAVEVAVAGAAVKGVIQQGIVTASRLVADGEGVYSEQNNATKPTRTADDGSYALKLRGKSNDWALVEITADGKTRMICDVVPQCEQAGAAPVAFGQPLTLDSNFMLSGAGDPSAETVNLTPLTHLAVSLAKRSASGLSPDAISNAYAEIEGWFGLSAGALQLPVPDLTRLDDMASVSADAVQVAITNAAFLALVNDNTQWNSISDVMADAISQVSTTGQLSIMGDGTHVALADIVSAAALQSSELQATVDSSVISQKLVVVEYRNVNRFKTIADVYGDSDTSVADNTDTTDPTGGTDTATDGSTEPTGETSGSVEPGTGEVVADSGAGSTETVADGGAEGSTDTVIENSVPANAAMLSWTAPLTRENGESLTMGEIAGYEVVYGSSADNLDQSLAIGDASVDELLVDNLDTGTWYFAIRTLDIDGNRSQLSDVVYKQI